MKRAGSVGEPRAIVHAIQSTDLETLVERIAWDGKNLPPFAQKNVAKTPLVGGQWRLSDRAKYDIVIVDNATAPQIPVPRDSDRPYTPRQLSLRCPVANDR
jgi:branched-chain amino acid transport system substrate-binding protein